jgi:hypothetical protein
MTSMIACEAVIERFRCPEEFAHLGVNRTNDASQGFFKFGEDVVCYGRCSWGTPHSYLSGNLLDVLSVMKANGGTTSLPFDPDEVVGNLQCERYVAATNSDDFRSSFVQACRATYYRLRPAMPSFLRAYAKKAYLAGWEKTPFPQWPVDRTVDHLLENLLELSLATQKNTEIPFIWFWPDGCESCAVMTHDVETTAGRDLIGAVMELDESAGIKASFQIIPEERYAISETLLGQIRSRGFEVNVHDLNHDGRLFDDRREFLDRARRINSYSREYRAIGFRSAVMYRNQDWYDAFEFEYDMSVPNVAHLDPQHGGCCTVMPYFIGNILELPLTTVQDYFLFYILQNYSIDLWKRQIEMIKQQHGLISFIIHPDYIVAERSRATYKTLLEYLASLRGSGTVWFALPGEANCWWRQRSKMRLIRHASGWKIEGEGADRARIAYAHVVDGRLAYRIGQPPSVLNSAEGNIGTNGGTRPFRRWGSGPGATGVA